MRASSLTWPSLMVLNKVSRVNALLLLGRLLGLFLAGLFDFANIIELAYLVFVVFHSRNGYHHTTKAAKSLHPLFNHSDRAFSKVCDLIQ